MEKCWEFSFAPARKSVDNVPLLLHEFFSFLVSAALALDVDNGGAMQYTYGEGWPKRW